MKILRVKPAIAVIVTVFLLCLNIQASAESEPKERILNDVTENINLADSDFDFYEETEKIANGENSTDVSNVISDIFSLFFSAFKENLHLLIKIAALCIFSGVINAITGEDASQLSFLACLILVTALAVDVLKNVLLSAETTIDRLLIFMQSLIPSIAMLSTGAENTFAVSFHPALFASIQTIIYACKEWFLPMILFTSALAVVNSMTARFHLTKLLETCRLFIKWGLGLLMTLYVALLGIHGFGGAIQAGAMSKTVKYAIASFVPTVGGVLAESAESVLTSMQLIKSSVGIAGIMAIFAITLSPLLNILATSVVFRLSASLSEPAADKRIIKLVSDFASSVSLIFSILLAVCAMFIISVAMLLTLTNMSQTMR